MVPLSLCCGVAGANEATVRAGLKSLNDGVVLGDCNLPEVPVILEEDKSMSLSEAKSQVHQFSVTWYPSGLGEFPAAAPEELWVLTCPSEKLMRILRI